MRRDILKLVGRFARGHKEGGSEDVRWRYEFDDRDGKRRAIEFTAIPDTDAAFRLLADLRDQLNNRESVEIAT